MDNVKLGFDLLSYIGGVLVVIAGFIWRMGRKSAKMEGDISELKKDVDGLQRNYAILLSMKSQMDVLSSEVKSMDGSINRIEDYLIRGKFNKKD